MKTLRATVCAATMILTTSAQANVIDVTIGSRIHMIDVSFSSGAVTSGSPSVYTVSNNFILPTGFTSASLTIGNWYTDDRGVLQLNGTIISNGGIYGPGLGSMTMSPGGTNDPFTFTFGNGVQNVLVTTGFLVGLNTLSLIVNDTNNGIFGAPLVGGVNISGADVVATLGFVTPVTAVPEPATLALLGIGLFGIASLGRRKV